MEAHNINALANNNVGCYSPTNPSMVSKLIKLLVEIVADEQSYKIQLVVPDTFQDAKKW